MKDGVFRQYRGARDKDSFISFVEDKKWTQIEEVAAWTHPDSVQMTMVSYFFKLSMVLRNVHSTLTEEYEFPYWVSYVAFAVATILLGGVLGLLLVCCIDCVFPPRCGRNSEISGQHSTVYTFLGEKISTTPIRPETTRRIQILR